MQITRGEVPRLYEAAFCSRYVFRAVFHSPMLTVNVLAGHNNMVVLTFK
jgi:hypothetical protein